MIRVGVLRGGPSAEYEVSLKTGGSVLEHLSPEKYRAHDILITKDGNWHMGGLPTTPARAAGQVDVFFNALHGEYGEDGRLQNQLDQLGVPYTGSGTFASAVAMKKSLAKEVYRRAGIKTPSGLMLRRGDGEIAQMARAAWQKAGPPWVVKPADRGSSVGLFLATDFTQLVEAIAQSFAYSDNVLVEEYIPGKEATVGVVENFREREHYALPVIEIRRPGGAKVWGYDDKYNGSTEEVCPGCFSDDEKRALEELAVRAHQALGLRHYSRSDFILHPRRGIYILETNTLPGLTSESLLPKAINAVGSSYPEFLDHVVNLALNERR